MRYYSSIKKVARITACRAPLIVTDYATKPHLASNTKLLTRHTCSVNPSLNFLHGDTTCEVRAPVFRLPVDTKRTESVIVGRT